MRLHSIDNRADSDTDRALINRSFWLTELPRPLPRCWLFGHRPVVDGTGEPGRHVGRVARWVVCGRCGTRPHPQGSLDPGRWRVGERYTAPIPGPAAGGAGEPGRAAVGPWPRRPPGEIGGQVVIGNNIVGGASVSVRVSCPGDEHVLSCHINLHPLIAVYLHTEGFGKGLQRRINNTGYESKAVDARVGDGRLHWRLWSPVDSWSASTPRWRDGSVRVDLRDVLLGERRVDFTDHATAAGVVRMPDGDDHEVELTLRRQRVGRRRGRGEMSWTVWWSSRPGIPIRNHEWKGDEVYASSVRVTADAVECGRWQQEACAAIAAHLSRDRAHYRWRPPTPTAQEPA